MISQIFVLLGLSFTSALTADVEPVKRHAVAYLKDPVPELYYKKYIVIPADSEQIYDRDEPYDYKTVGDPIHHSTLDSHRKILNYQHDYDIRVPVPVYKYVLEKSARVADAAEYPRKYILVPEKRLEIPEHEDKIDVDYDKPYHNDYPIVKNIFPNDDEYVVYNRKYVR